MRIEEIQAQIMPELTGVQTQVPAQPSGAARTDFVTWLQSQVTEANSAVVEADQQVRKLAVGEAENLHQVMLAISDARSQVDLLLQVRNRLVEGYQELLRMRI